MVTSRDKAVRECLDSIADILDHHHYTQWQLKLLISDIDLVYKLGFRDGKQNVKYALNLVTQLESQIEQFNTLVNQLSPTCKERGMPNPIVDKLIEQAKEKNWCDYGDLGDAPGFVFTEEELRELFEETYTSG